MKHRGVALAWVLVAGMGCGGVALADTRSEDPAEARARAIAKELRCAVCQNQSVYDSNSELAKDMLKVIRDKVQSGETDAAIRDYFHQRYGDYIYLEPTAAGSNLLLWGLPFMGLLVGAGALWLALRRWRRGAAEGVTASSVVEDPQRTAMQERIKQELERVDY
ncbi:MAG: cytochrome c-type biogenesis protein CcmH [Magnetococcus sp. WYHC-3]